MVVGMMKDGERYKKKRETFDERHTRSEACPYQPNTPAPAKVY